MNRISSYLVLLLALATLCAGLPLGKRDPDCTITEDCIDYSGIEYSDSYAANYGSYKNEKYLRIITPNSGTVWQADSYQSVTWAFDGSAHLGYGETVTVILLAVDDYGNWKKVDTLQPGTTGSGISNYHVRKDLGKAHAYKVVLEIESVQFRAVSQSFKIQPISGHNNGYEDDSEPWKDSYSKAKYLRLMTPNENTVWDADSYQSVTWSYDGSSNLGYGETVIVLLFARDSDTGNWKQVDKLPSGTTGGGISNYHVRKDLGKAEEYIVVLEIEEVRFSVASEPFKIKSISGHSNEGDSWDNDYSNKKQQYLRPITPNSQTVWDADSYQSVTWSYDGSTNLGYGEKVYVYLLARQSDGSWKKVDELPSATTGSGISNYHVRKDLGKASEYKVVLEIESVDYYVATESFKIKSISGHSNEGDSWDNDYSNKKQQYLQPITPNSQTVWDADSYQSVTWSYDGSTNLGYGEKVYVYLLARQSDGSWKKVDELPSATTGSGISNYHVRKDLGKASEYKVVLEIESVDYYTATEAFVIHKIAEHKNDYEYNPTDDDDNDKGAAHTKYISISAPDTQSIWKTGTDETITWSYDDSSNINRDDKVTLTLYAYDSSSKSVSVAGEIGQWNVSTRSVSYHVPDDLQIADYFVIVFTFERIQAHVHTQPFKIEKS